MSRDYARKPRPPTRHKGSIPGWVWLITGIATGAFIMFLMYLSGIAPSNKLADQNITATDQKTPAPKQQKPVFEFYDTLMNNEVIAPPLSSVSPEQTNNDAPTVTYMLQAASFKKLSEADSLKAKLTLDGMDISIAEFNNHGEIYYRVMVGPFTDVSKMTATKKILATYNISPIVLQKKPGA